MTRGDLVFVIMGEKQHPTAGRIREAVYIATSEAEAAEVMREKITYLRLGGDPAEVPWTELTCSPMRIGVWADLVELDESFKAAGPMPLLRKVCEWADPKVAAEGLVQASRAARRWRADRRKRAAS